MKTPTLLIAAAFPLLVPFSAVQADPAKAEDDAYSMAVHYQARGFYMSPTNTSGLGQAGMAIKVMIPVTKGLDYVILIGRDAFAADIDLYVYDEVGQLILDDRRPASRAGVKFRSSYSGTVEAVVHLAQVKGHGLASYAVLVGRRGIVAEGAKPASMGVEPVFEMDNTTPAPPTPEPTKK